MQPYQSNLSSHVASAEQRQSAGQPCEGCLLSTSLPKCLIGFRERTFGLLVKDFCFEMGHVFLLMVPSQLHSVFFPHIL